VVAAELWKLGQLKPGNTVRFVRLSRERAARLDAEVERVFVNPAETCLPTLPLATGIEESCIVTATPAREDQVAVTYRQAGDRNLLVEYGPLILDLNLRFRVHALMTWLQQRGIPGIVDLTPGIRSLQVHYDRSLELDELMRILAQAEAELPGIEDMEVPTRIVHLPLSWDDPSTQLAIEKYMQSVRKDAPWCPSNIEFIRRINGLDSIEQVKEILFNASYLVMGLGDVYLGAPVATPIDPRHRLVTTKYNPARTWTPENAVGIGGAYLCVYGMEGPGGYQFVGRTVPMWNRYRQTADFRDGKPWLLRFFDQIRFYPVSAEELLRYRQDVLSGKLKLDIREETFSLRQYNDFLREHAGEIAECKSRQQAAFDAERERWEQAGQIYADDQTVAAAAIDTELELPPGARAVASHIAGNVWQVLVQAGDSVRKGDALVVVESMKMEFPVPAPEDGTVWKVFCNEGAQISAGQDLLVLQAGEDA
jgi:urea carboxylase